MCLMELEGSSAPSHHSHVLRSVAAAHPPRCDLWAKLSQVTLPCSCATSAVVRGNKRAVSQVAFSFEYWLQCLLKKNCLAETAYSEFISWKVNHCCVFLLVLLKPSNSLLIIIFIINTPLQTWGCGTLLLILAELTCLKVFCKYFYSW